jgi:hypothetical protein
VAKKPLWKERRYFETCIIVPDFLKKRSNKERCQSIVRIRKKWERLMVARNAKSCVIKKEGRFVSAMASV